MVTAMSSFGIPQPDICAVIGVTEKTLRRAFRRELDTATARANTQVAGTLFKAATNPSGGMKSVVAAIFWLKTRARWREESKVEISGTLGVKRAHELTDDELAAIAGTGRPRITD